MLNFAIRSLREIAIHPVPVEMLGVSRLIRGATVAAAFYLTAALVRLARVTVEAAQKGLFRETAFPLTCFRGLLAAVPVAFAIVCFGVVP